MPKSTKHAILRLILKNPAFVRWLRRLNARIDKEVDAIKQKVDTVDDKVDTLNSNCGKKIDAVSHKVSVVDTAIGKKIHAVSQKLDDVDGNIQKKIDDAGYTVVDTVDNKIDAVCDKVDVIGGVSIEKINAIGEKVDEIGYSSEEKIDAVCHKVDLNGGVVLEKVDTVGNAVDKKIDTIGDSVIAKVEEVGDRVVGKIDGVGDRIAGKADAIGDKVDVLSDDTGQKIDTIGATVGVVGKKIDKVERKTETAGRKVDKALWLLEEATQQARKNHRASAQGLRVLNTRIGEKVDALGNATVKKIDEVGDIVDTVHGKLNETGNTLGVVSRKVNATGDRVLAKVGLVERKVDTILSYIDAGTESNRGFRSNWEEATYRSVLLAALVFAVMLELLFAAFLIGVGSNSKLDNAAFSFTSTEKLCITAGVFSRGTAPLLSDYFEGCRKTLDQRFTVDPSPGAYFRITPKEPASKEDSADTLFVEYVGVGPGFLGAILGYGAYIVFILTILLASLSLVKMLVWDDSFSRFGVVSGTLLCLLAMFGLSFYLATHTSAFMTLAREKAEPYGLYRGNVEHYQTGKYVSEGDGKLDKLIARVEMIEFNRSTANGAPHR
uniref:Uncharacterized protein n=1 Tax=Candidatus Kentrum sp. UNK TaxID=2126344 RepID=A0A451AV96_9GAMM|nr:MAG: hypothetical protein BECKUNK1418G_GA0071005_10196 [Candidatus Kentron sp. UNK]VFK69980.1 MAG: hypothetical protein BECKUNK1418H_GA0071006_10226 [Candidatus Kentron sp. UNK]